MASSQEISAFALAINSDASNRLKKLKGDRQVSGLKTLVNSVQNETSQKLSILTISEMGNITAGRELASNLKWKCEVETLMGTDIILTAYDPKVWEQLTIEKGDYVISAEGRYLALKLQMKKGGMTLLYFSVHLPHKKNRQEAYESLADAIEALSKDVDIVMVGGDWNMKPSVIKTQFQKLNLELAFTEDSDTLEEEEEEEDKAEGVVEREADAGAQNREAKTEDEANGTKKIKRRPRRIDNFALLQKDNRLWLVNFGEQKQIMQEFKNVYTTHAPIWVEVKFVVKAADSVPADAGSKSGDRSNEPGASDSKENLQKKGKSSELRES